jgi:hypothetical protein
MTTPLVLIYKPRNQYFVAEDFANPELSEADCYKNICVEFEVVGFAVNTILEAAKINEIEVVLGYSVHLLLQGRCQPTQLGF